MREEGLSLDLSRMKASYFELESTLKANKVKLESTGQLLTEQSHLNSSLIAKTNILESKLKGMQAEVAHERAGTIDIGRELRKGAEENEKERSERILIEREASELKMLLAEAQALEEQLRSELSKAVEMVAKQKRELKDARESALRDRETHALHRSSSQEELGSIERKAEERVSKLEGELEAMVQEAKALEERVEDSERSKEVAERRSRESTEKAKELMLSLERLKRKVKELGGERDQLSGEVKHKVGTLDLFKKRLGEAMEVSKHSELRIMTHIILTRRLTCCRRMSSSRESMSC